MLTNEFEIIQNTFFIQEISKVKTRVLNFLIPAVNGGI